MIYKRSINSFRITRFLHRVFWMRHYVEGSWCSEDHEIFFTCRMSLALCVSLFILCCLALHDTSEPSLDTLKKYTIYSYAAYCTDGLKAWSCYWCKGMPKLGSNSQTEQPSIVPAVKVSTIFENDGTYGTYGYVGASSQEILISFRGTRGIDDWLKDLDFFQTPYPTVSTCPSFACLSPLFSRC